MKVRQCVAPWLVVGFSVLAITPQLSAQDSGPGPVSPATEAVYDATLIRFFGNLAASFTFSAGEGGQGIFTTGAFEADVNGSLVTGTWQAVDVGSFAVWSATASGETSTFIAAGFATPTNLVGQAVTNVAGGGRLRYLIVGEAGVVEPPAE
jgi:hypothetical protein